MKCFIAGSKLLMVALRVTCPTVTSQAWTADAKVQDINNMSKWLLCATLRRGVAVVASNSIVTCV
jgi:hypothetical protein